MVSEAEMLEAARAGDSDAFAELVRQHKDMVWAISFRICRNAADAEDAAQEAFIAAWRYLDRFEGRASFRTWLYRIATNASLMVVRARREEPLSNIDERAGSDTFDEHTVDRLTVAESLMQLPMLLRESVVLYHFGGLSYGEIAILLEIPIDTVKTRIFRAREQLAALLAVT